MELDIKLSFIKKSIGGINLQPAYTIIFNIIGTPILMTSELFYVLPGDDHDGETGYETDIDEYNEIANAIELLCQKAISVSEKDESYHTDGLKQYNHKVITYIFN